SCELLIFCWIAYCVMRYELAARGALMALVIACAIVAFLEMIGLPPRTVVNFRPTTRLTFGLDPNQLAGCFTAGVLSLLGLAYGSRVRNFPRWLVPILFIALGVEMLQTGSRGGLIALTFGLVTLLLRGGSVWTRLRNLSLLVAGMGFFVLLILNTPSVRD